MGGKQSWKIRSFLICFICNGVLIAFFLRSKDFIGGIAAPAFLAVGGVLTLSLWLLVLSASRGLTQAPEVAAPPPVTGERPSPEAAVQLLAALQREGRLIDFLQEDLSPYQDGQIGAAVRNIHEGCKKALKEHMEIKPIFEEKEGAVVTVPPGFDARNIRLTGNVTGNPPFRGILRHRGWKVESIQPPQSVGQKDNRILAPGEVEVE